MSLIKIGQPFGSEELDIEFKELCLQNLHVYFSHDDIYNLLYSNIKLNQSIFTKMIENDIDYCIGKYVPKYMGNFSKANISGDLYIGIDDLGFVKGIPYYGLLTKEFVKESFLSSKINSRGIIISDSCDPIYDQSIVDWYYSNTTIDVIKLESKCDDELEVDLKQSLINLKKIEKKNKKIIDKWNIYRVAYKDWHDSLSKYSGKLINYLIDLDIKKDLIKYICDDFESDPLLDKSYLDFVLEFYSHDTSYYQELTLSLDYIESLSKDEYSPILWLIKYKDIMCKHWKKLKPIHPGTSPNNKIYYKFANSVLNIRPQLIKSDPTSDINFYLIKISIPNMPNTYLEYKHYNDWVSKTRIIIESGPSCI
jgi:hypothetical protein